MEFIKGLIITILSTSILKNITKVPRPSTFPSVSKGIVNSTHFGWSFPSGHSSISTFVFGWIYKKYPSAYTLLLFIIGWWYFALRSYLLGYHRLNEVIAGTILGLIILNYL